MEWNQMKRSLLVIKVERKANSEESRQTPIPVFGSSITKGFVALADGPLRQRAKPSRTSSVLYSDR